ncbi:MAG TPA: hypothetical protein VL137_17740, partial [Polyangiaceae bacterium]|nr:hypothetical protein [Polyangiaceae bacterium]
IRWQLSPPHLARKPGKQNTPAAPADYTGSATLAIGQREISQVWTFHPGDPIGTWNIRVTMDQQVLIDRQFFVYDRKTQADLNRKLDAGAAH